MNKTQLKLIKNPKDTFRTSVDKLIHYTDNHSDIDETKFDYVIEVSAWSDTGTTEYVGVAGDLSQSDLIDLLRQEIDELHAWFDEEAQKGYMDERTDEPQIARILQRPTPDEDGNYPARHEWPVYFNWN